jgi:hypothetical protein
LLWQHWHTVQVDPAQAELKTYWHLLDEETQAFLKAKCADGEVYQHVVRAQPATEAAHLQKLESDRSAMVKANEAQVLELNAQWAAQKAGWLLEKEVTAAQNLAVINGLAAKEKNTQATLEWTESQLQNHKQSIQELHAEIAAIKQSTSWRITAPLRKLLRKISD